MDPLLLPLNDNVDNAVKEFAECITQYARKSNPAADVVVDYDDATKADGTERASIATIFSNYGVVTVFPDFKYNTATATIMNRGMVQAMMAEDFSDAEIGAEKIYSAPVSYTDENAQMLAAFLTVDMGLQHQKRLTPLTDSGSRFSDL